MTGGPARDAGCRNPLPVRAGKRRLRLAVSILGLLLVLVAISRPSAAGERSREELILGRQAELVGEQAGDLVLLGADARLLGRVDGDVVAWGGRLELGPAARIEGSLLLIGTTLDRSPSSVVQGRSWQWSDAESALRSMVAGGEVPVSTVRRWVLGAELALLAAWLVLALALSIGAGSRLESTARLVAAAPFRCFVAGLGFVASTVLLVWGALGVFGVGFALALGLLLAAALLGLKIFGLSAAFVAIGRLLARMTGKGRVAPASPVAATVGLLLLGGVRLLPYVGSVVWFAGSAIGIGAAALRLVGRDRPA